MNENKTESKTNSSGKQTEQNKQPAYLFWKIQSKVVKLNQRLNKLKSTPFKKNSK